MTEISEAAKAKAAELIRADPFTTEPHHYDVAYIGRSNTCMAFARFIQEVSDAAKAATTGIKDQGDWRVRELAPFILPEPVDPLDEVLKAAGVCRGQVAEVKAELAKRGLKIVPVQP